MKFQMVKMEKAMAIMTQKDMESSIVDGAQGPRDLPTSSWTTSERYDKYYTYKFW